VIIITSTPEADSKAVWGNEKRNTFTPGLPDGKFSNQESPFREILEDLEKEVYGHFGNLVYFPLFW
jgi:hypothetical protein